MTSLIDVLTGAFHVDWTPFLILGVSAVLIPSARWLIKGQISLETRMTAHEQVDATRFADIQQALGRVEGGQRDFGEKLDRAIERLPARRG